MKLDAAGRRAKLDKLMLRVHREADGAGADPFDGAMLAAAAGVAEAMKAEADALEEMAARSAKLARRA